MSSKAQCRDAALQMHRPAQQVMNEPNAIFYPKRALAITMKKNKEKVLMTAYGLLGIGGDTLKGYSPLLRTYCSYIMPGCIAKSVSCIRKQMSISKV